MSVLVPVLKKKRASRLKQQIVRAGERHISTGILAKAAAWLRPFMPLVAHGFSVCLARSSHSLAYAQGTMFFIRAEGLIPDARIGGVDCRVQLLRPHFAPAGSSTCRASVPAVGSGGLLNLPRSAHPPALAAAHLSAPFSLPAS